MRRRACEAPATLLCQLTTSSASHSAISCSSARVSRRLLDRHELCCAPRRLGPSRAAASLANSPKCAEEGDGQDGRASEGALSATAQRARTNAETLALAHRFSHSAFSGPDSIGSLPTGLPACRLPRMPSMSAGQGGAAGDRATRAGGGPSPAPGRWRREPAPQGQASSTWFPACPQPTAHRRPRRAPAFNTADVAVGEACGCSRTWARNAVRIRKQRAEVGGWRAVSRPRS